VSKDSLLYEPHAQVYSLGPAEYEHLLVTNGFVVRAYVAQDAECGDHTVWLATCDAALAA